MITHKQALSISPEGKNIHTGIPGFYLYKTNKKGRGQWLFRFVSPVTGRRRDYILGYFPEISVKDALDEGMRLRRLVDNGGDPLEERIKTVIPQNDMITFEEFAIKFHEEKNLDFSDGHRKRWIGTLARHIFPAIGSRQIADLTMHDFYNVLNPIWRTTPDQAGRIKDRCAKIMDYYIFTKGLDIGNPVELALAGLGQRPIKNQHRPCVPFEDLPDFVYEHLSASPLDGVRAIMLFGILTAARSKEVREAKWKEIDFKSKIWVLSPERMKARKEHRVPLSSQALKILANQKLIVGDSPEEFIFARTKGKPMSDVPPSKFLRERNIPSDTEGQTATFHGFRSTFRSWASERDYPRDVAEQALAHTVENKVERAYKRTDHLEARKIMMQDWADYAFSKISSTKSLENEIANEPQATVEEALPIDTHTGYSSDSKADSKPLDITKPKHVVFERKNQATIKSASPDKKIVPVEVRKKRISSKP